VENNKSTMVTPWAAAGLALLAGVLLSIRSLNDLASLNEIGTRRTSAAHELSIMRIQAARHQSILAGYASQPAEPVPFETLVHSTLPGQAMTLLATGTFPSVQGWSGRKITVEFTDIAGEDLGKLLDAGAAAKPPWALVECTLFASPVQGRLSKATLVMETVERNASTDH